MPGKDFRGGKGNKLSPAAAQVKAALEKADVNSVQAAGEKYLADNPGVGEPKVSPAVQAMRNKLARKVQEQKSVVGNAPRKEARPAQGGAMAAVKQGLAAAKEQRNVMGKPKHVIIKALAGTGKTTTIVQGVKGLMGQDPTFIGDERSGKCVQKITPSPQQEAIWSAIMESKGARSVCMVAFNNSIADHLKNIVPPGVEAKTNHGMGFAAVSKAFGRGIQLDKYRVNTILCELLGYKSPHVLRREKPLVVRAVNQMVGLCKMNLVGCMPDVLKGAAVDHVPGTHFMWDEMLNQLAMLYDVEIDDEIKAEVYQLVASALDICKNDVSRHGVIDYNDMIWLPVVLNLPMWKNDMLLVDEMQDLNRCQQALVLKAGDRIIGVGDPNQSIYGFAGADPESINRMVDLLSNTDRGCTVLPLTVTRRCGKAIVQEARKIVPEFEAHDSNSEGRVRYATYKAATPVDSYHSQVADGDMILCRANAPLVNQCFAFLKQGRKAVIRGRNIAEMLTDLIDKLFKDYSLEEAEELHLATAGTFDKPSEIPVRVDKEVGQFPGDEKPGPVDAEISMLVPAKRPEIVYLLHRVHEWRQSEIEKEQANPNPCETKIQAINDKCDCICYLCEGETVTVRDIRHKLDMIFTDSTQVHGILLSSIHKAKGLEADRVFLLQPPGAKIVRRKTRTQCEAQQNLNLLYVATTRPKHELIYVS